MSLIKKKILLDNYITYDKVLDNNTLSQIENYNDILESANFKAKQILNQAIQHKQQILDTANQEAQNIVYEAQQQASENLDRNNQAVQSMLEAANDQVEDILINSEQRANQDVWSKASELINALNHANQVFYTNTQELINNLIKTIIKKLTTDLDTQSKMHILSTQIFEKAKEIEVATLFFNPKDFEELPSLHIPHTWKVEKDLMLDSGWCRLVGAGGEWKTSIAFIERKIIEGLKLDNTDNNLLIDSTKDE
jgi:vacuolar-type H+-ATPase subunit E/Vma4